MRQDTCMALSSVPVATGSCSEANVSMCVRSSGRALAGPWAALRETPGLLATKTHNSQHDSLQLAASPTSQPAAKGGGPRRYVRLCGRPSARAGLPQTPAL